MVEVPLIFQLLINGLLVGSVYGLAALGLSLVWGVMRVVNIAHGEVIMISAFTSYWLFVLFGIHPLASLAITIPLGMLLGFAIYLGLVGRVIERADRDLMTLVLMLGVQAIIYGFASYSWGIDIRSIPILLPTLSLGTLAIPWSRLSTAIISVAVVISVYFFLKRTSYGKAIRAITQNREAAMLVGIRPHRVFTLSFALGTALASLAGTLLTLTNPAITPLMGLDFLLRSFAIVVLGGIGNPVGTLVGGIVLGLAEGVSSLLVPFTATVAVAFILLIIVLIVKPEGLFESMR